MTTAPTIDSNFSAWLAYRGIDGAELEMLNGDDDRFADRIFFRDRGAVVLQTMLLWNATHDAYDPLHGSSLILSLRERSSPSGQLCVHRALDASTGKSYLFYEFDFDKAPPTSNPKFIAVHFGECVVNALTHGLTDQTAIARGLASRGVSV